MIVGAVTANVAVFIVIITVIVIVPHTYRVTHDLFAQSLTWL